MIKDLVFPVTRTAGDDNALAVAIGLATRERAHLLALSMVSLPVPAQGPWGLMTDLGMSEVYAKLRAGGEADAARWRERLAKAGVPFEVRATESMFVEPPRTAALHARFSDMSVMTGASDAADEAAVIHAFFTALLLESGRPVLVVPPRFSPDREVKHAVIAWRPTREASRALHEALPLLRAVETIDVLEIDPEPVVAGEGARSVADIATHLGRHDLKVRVVTHARSHETTSLALIRHVEQSGAGLLVAGGYGHSRLREWTLGGVTRDLLRHSPVPVLFSH